MELFDRVSLLFKADAHGVMDQLEERSLLLKQHLREAERELTRKRARVETMEDEQRRLEDEVEHLESQVKSLDDDIDLALSGGNDDLARFAVRRLLPKRQSLESLQARIAQLGDERGRLAERLAVQECDFEELKSRVRARLAFMEQREEAGAGVPEALVADEEIEFELLRRRPVGAEGA